mmetsp:Transcript_35686/g.81041  ORF Transcript_35686/g.81041 Transcript_35686/m.81041 type:complete len:82 (-) Transcript_35686:892-1137(-)
MGKTNPTHSAPAMATRHRLVQTNVENLRELQVPWRVQMQVGKPSSVLSSPVATPSMLAAAACAPTVCGSTVKRQMMGEIER